MHFSKKYSKCEWFCDGGNILTASDFDILSVSLLRTIFFEYSKCESRRSTRFPKQVKTKMAKDALDALPCSMFSHRNHMAFFLQRFGCCLDDRTWRGYKDRQYVTALRSDKAGRDLTDLCRFVSPSLLVQGSLRPPNA